MIQALRDTAARLATGDPYQWGHMGSCNCGHLAQTITRYSKGTIHRAAMGRYGDWREQLRDYCPRSGLPLDEIIDQMVAWGLTREDLSHLESLTHPKVLAHLPSYKKYLRHNVREDVVRYLKAWARLLETQLAENICFPPAERALAMS